MTATPAARRAAVRHRRPLARAALVVLALALVVAGGLGGALLLALDPVRGLPAWDQLDTRWGTYLPERQWGTPREAVGRNGWGLDYLKAGRTEYRYGEDGIAGLTTRDGAFNLGWAAWDGRQVRVTERLFGWSNPSGVHGEAIVDRRTFGENTPTSSYHRSILAYPAVEPVFEITFEGARADDHAGVARATARNTTDAAAGLDLVFKGWFHDPERRVELLPDGLLLRGTGSVVAIVGSPPTSSQVAAGKRDLDVNLRDGGLSGAGPGHIGALAWHQVVAPGASARIPIAWAEASDAATAEQSARGLLGGLDRVVAFRATEAGSLFRGRVTAHEAVYRQALMSLLWSQALYTWDGASTYDPRWAGKVDAHDVLVMPDKWEFPWLASWDTGFQSVAASLVDPQLGADQLRFLLSDRWQQPDGHVPCAEWVMDVECPPVFAWAALRIADAGAGNAFLREIYPALGRLYDYWWRTNAVAPDGLFTGGFLGMDNLPRATGRAQADATGWMAFLARDLGRIATTLGDAAGADRYASDAARIAAALNANLWDEERGFYFDLDADGRSFIPTVSYTGLVPLIAGVVPADRVERVLDAVRDPRQMGSPFGVRSVAANSVIYEPGYAAARGTNSNWRGPMWVPLNVLLVEAVEPLDAALAATIREAVVTTVETDWAATGRFHEYFDGDTGQGIGADAQTGWTALVANLVADGWPAQPVP